MNQYLAAFFPILLTAVPIVALGVAGMGVALARRAAHPGVSLLASLGFVLLILAALGQVGVTTYLVTSHPDRTQLAAFAARSALASFGLGAVNLGGLVLLTIAVFAGRKTAPGNA